MSYTEFHIGKLKPVDLEQKCLEDWCKKTLVLSGRTGISSYNHSWLEELQDVHYDKYYTYKDKLYEFIDHTETEDETCFCKLILKEDGIVEFIASFYNGGTCLSEMLNDEFDKL